MAGVTPASFAISMYRPDRTVVCGPVDAPETTSFFAARAQSQFYVVRTQEADLSAEVPEPDQRLAERARRVIPPPARKRSNFRGRTDSFKNDWLIAPGTRDREVRELE